MPFEFDNQKSLANLSKHGIDFVSAQILWDDPLRLETSAPSASEPRFRVVGTIDGKIWSAFITYREENIRSFPFAGRATKKRSNTMENKNKTLTAEELDALHDSGADMTSHLDMSTSHRPGLKTQRINVDFPQWMVVSLDREAERLGVTRQSVIKVWIAAHFETNSSNRESVTDSKYLELKKLFELGLTRARIAEALGISLSLVPGIGEDIAHLKPKGQLPHSELKESNVIR